MKKFIFFLIFFTDVLFSFSLQISNPSFAPQNEFNFINKRQEAALTDKRGFYYNLSAQYVPPYLIDLETDEYYMVNDNKNRFSLDRLCKENLIDLQNQSFLITVRINDEKKEFPVFVLSKREDKGCVFNKNIVYLDTKSYKKPIKIEINVKKREGFISDDFMVLKDSLNLKELKNSQSISFLFDPNALKTNTIYIPLSILDKDANIDIGFISLILHPVASKLSNTKFTSYGYPDLSKITFESIKPLEHPFNPKRNLRKDIVILRKAAFRQDLNVIDECDYFMSYIDEYDLNEYDRNLIFWLIFKDVPNFLDSLCYKEHEKYLVYTKTVPQPKDFIIPALKPEIPAKEIKRVVTLGSYNDVKEKIPFEANMSIKELQLEKMKEDSLPDTPLISNRDSNVSSKMVLAKESNEVIEKDFNESKNTPLKESKKEEIFKEDKRAKRKEFNYDNIPFSGISKNERIKLFKNLSSLFKAKNKKFLSKLIFPADEIYFTLLSDIPALKIEGLKIRETFILDRDTLAKILTPLEKSRFGCWFLLRSMKIKSSKAVSLGEELGRDDYEMVALYKDKNEEIGNHGYLLVYANFKKEGRRYVINSIAFDVPDENFYEIIKNRTSKRSRCYDFIQRFKKDIFF